VTTTTASPARSEAQRKAIARYRREQTARRAALVAEVDTAIAMVGWAQAKPYVLAVLGSGVPVSGPRGRWRSLLRVRSTRRLLAMLDALPAQLPLPLVAAAEQLAHRCRSVPTQEVPR